MSNNTMGPALVPAVAPATFNLEKFVIGPLLGSGGFSSVYAIGSCHQEQDELTAVVDLSSSEMDSSDSDPVAPPSPSRQSCCMDRSHIDDGDLLAIKRMHSNTLISPRRKKVAMYDIKNEVKIVSLLPRHANIIHFYGVSPDFPGKSAEETFIVMERLEESLDEIVRQWRRAEKGCFEGLKMRKRYLQKGSQAERIEKVAIGVASGMAFLNEHMIIFRDLKPGNVGVDRSGNVKLFDFGLARRLPNNEPQKLGRNGTLRYMAPEVASEQLYTFSADVYSFGLVLHEICTLKRPFHEISEKDDLLKIAERPKVHPPLRRISSPRIRGLLFDCWKGDPTQRPSFESIVSILKMEVASLLPDRRSG